VINSLQLTWIKGNGLELSDNLVLLNIPDEMILTASRKSEKICVQAGAFQFEFSAKHLPVTSESFRSIVAQSNLRIHPIGITLLEDNQTYKIENISIRVKVTGFLREFIINAGRKIGNTKLRSHISLQRIGQRETSEFLWN
jgi:hypothetical protein